MTALPTPNPAGLPHLSRRTLLAAGSALALASTVAGRALLRPAGGDGTLARLAASTGPRISIGFLDQAVGQILGRGPLDLSGRPRVVPAARVRADMALADSATARIVGLTPGVLDDPPLAGIQLDALFPDPEGDAPLRHHAWTLRTDPLSASPPVRFTAPIGSQSLGFELRTVPLSGDARDAISVLTGGDESDLPGLRPGTYLLGVGEGTWDAPARLPDVDDRAWAELASIVITILPR